jgi:hypothetical protein
MGSVGALTFVAYCALRDLLTGHAVIKLTAKVFWHTLRKVVSYYG